MHCSMDSEILDTLPNVQVLIFVATFSKSPETLPKEKLNGVGTYLVEKVIHLEKAAIFHLDQKRKWTSSPRQT